MCSKNAVCLEVTILLAACNKLTGISYTGFSKISLDVSLRALNQGWGVGDLNFRLRLRLLGIRKVRLRLLLVNTNSKYSYIFICHLYINQICMLLLKHFTFSQMVKYPDFISYGC